LGFGLWVLDFWFLFLVKGLVSTLWDRKPWAICSQTFNSEIYSLLPWGP